MGLKLSDNERAYFSRWSTWIIIASFMVMGSTRLGTPTGDSQGGQVIHFIAAWTLRITLLVFLIRWIVGKFNKLSLTSHFVTGIDGEDEARIKSYQTLFYSKAS
jgi:hypothetical protein